MTLYREKCYSKYVETLTRYSEKKDIQEEFCYRSKIYDLNYKRLLPDNKDSKILELGCGPGYFLKYLENNGYKNCMGVDWSEQQISKALDLQVRNIMNEDLFKFMRETDDKFDLICSFHVLEHLFKDEIIEFLELIHARLNKNGMCIIEVPNTSSPLFGGLGRYIDFTHEVGFTPPSLREVLLVSGFGKIQVLPVKGISPFARLFFKILNYILHSRFTRDMFVEGEIIGVGYKED